MSIGTIKMFSGDYDVPDSRILATRRMTRCLDPIAMQLICKKRQLHIHVLFFSCYEDLPGRLLSSLSALSCAIPPIVLDQLLQRARLLQESDNVERPVGWVELTTAYWKPS